MGKQLGNNLKNASLCDIMKKMKEDAEFQFRRGGWSTNDARHSIIHKIGHALSKQYMTKEKWEQLEALRKTEVLRVTGDAESDIMKVVKENKKLAYDWGKGVYVVADDCPKDRLEELRTGDEEFMKKWGEHLFSPFMEDKKKTDGGD